MNIPVGTISHGSLLIRDLTDAAITALSLLDSEAGAEAQKEAEQLRALASEGLEHDDLDDFYVRMEDRVNELLPEGYYYGGLEGDPSDVGIWQVDEDE